MKKSEMLRLDPRFGPGSSNCGWCRRNSKPACWKSTPEGYSCTREEGHKGRCVACGITMHDVDSPDFEERLTRVYDPFYKAHTKDSV